VIYSDSTMRKAADMRASGYTYPEISRRTGVPVRTIRRWVNPDHEVELLSNRESKRRRTGVCQQCGGVTKHSGQATARTHPNGASLTCRICNNKNSGARLHHRLVWTPEHIVETLRAAAIQLGRSPTCADTQIQHRYPSVLIRNSHQRIAEVGVLSVELPPTNSVRIAFGGWGEALDAAELQRPLTGHPAHRTSP
jgi:hypothetical protein